MGVMTSSSPRVVLCTLGTSGDLLPFLALAERLRDRGARPLLLLNPHDLPRAEARGLEARPVGEPMDFDAMIRARPALMGPQGGTIVVREVYVPWNAALLKAARAALAAEPADAVVCHTMGLGLAWAAREQGVPVSVAHLAPMSRFDTADLGHMPWAVGALLRAVLPIGLWAIDRWLKPVCAAGEVPWHPGMLWRGPSAAGLELGLWSPLLEQEPTGDLVRCGFPLPPQGPLPPDLEAFLDGGEPPIAVALGTSAVHIAGALIPRAVAAGRRVGRRVLVFGEHHVEGDDALVVPRAPYGSALPRCCAVIHHGGIGTSAAGLWAGIPALVTPFAHDQPDNAARLARLGNVSGGRGWSARKLARGLETLLSPAVTRAARQLGQQLRAEGDGADHAAAAVLDR